MEQRHHNPFLGTFELALFMAAGVRRFPQTLRAMQYSFIVPILLLFVWVYPLYKVPTPMLGERSYEELILIHVSIMTLHLAVFYAVLWHVAKALGKSDRVYGVMTMKNFCALIGFVFTAPLFWMVLSGHHTWDEVFGAFILVSFYEVALGAYILTRGLGVPWQFGTGLAFMSMFIGRSASATVFALFGIG